MTDQKRPYRMKKRAELEEATRRRITESAVALHGTVGPARTSVSALAEHAGVRRSTVYRHFPDEASLFAACTAHWAAENPVPDIGAWAAIEDPDERLRAALAALYPYYRSTAGMMENLIRDEPVSELVRKHFAGYHGYIDAAREALLRGRRVARPRPHARARRDRPRARVRDVALAGPRRGPRRRAGGRARDPAGRVPVMPARLVTIPISHYCEKARWALDRAGVAYREERHVQIVHRVASRRAGGGGTVPVLVAPEGVFAQSADILAYADRHRSRARLYPGAGLRAEVVALERGFDADLGPEGRRWMYFHILPRRDLGIAYNCTGVPGLGAARLPADARRDVGLHPPPVRHRARDRRAGRRGGSADVRRGRRAPGGRAPLPVRRRLHRRRPRLRRPGRARDRPARVRHAAAPSPTRCRAEMAAGVRAFRAHPAGAFACRLFREER